MEPRVGRTLIAGLVLSAVLGADTLRLVTVNVWSGLDYKGSFKMGEYEDRSTRTRRIEIITRQLKELDADVIAINEANKLPGYARRLARELGYDYVYHVGVGGLRAGCIGLPTNLREGDAILAKRARQLKSAGRLKLSGGCVGNFFTLHFSDATQIIGARIVIGSKNVYVFSTHWHASPFMTEHYLSHLDEQLAAGKIDQETYDRRRAEATEGAKWRHDEARRTVAFIDKVAGHDIAVVMGDLNALADAEEIALLKEAGFVDAYEKTGSPPGYTYDDSVNTNITLQQKVEPERKHQWPGRKRIDYIFVRGSDLDITDARVVINQEIDGLFASDHFGVLTEILIR